MNTYKNIDYKISPKKDPETGNWNYGITVYYKTEQINFNFLEEHPNIDKVIEAAHKKAKSLINKHLK